MTRLRDQIRAVLLCKANYEVQTLQVPSRSWLGRVLGLSDTVQLMNPSESMVDSVIDIAMRELGRSDPTVASCADYGRMKLVRVMGNLLEWKELDASRRIVETITASKGRFGEKQVATAILSLQGESRQEEMVDPGERITLVGSPEEFDRPESA